MGLGFTLDQDMVNTAKNIFDDIINNLGKNCQLVYPGKMVDCTCTPDTIGNKPTNHWTTGGPASVGQMTNCALCGGTSKKMQETTETIKFYVVWNPKEYAKILTADKNFRLPANSVIKVKGFIWDLPKVLKCTHMICQLPLEPYVSYKFTLDSEGVPRHNIVQDRYFENYWVRS